MEPTTGYLFWYITGCYRGRIEDPVLRINSMKFHPIWLENETFFQLCATTEDLLAVSEEGVKAILVNK